MRLRKSYLAKSVCFLPIFSFFIAIFVAKINIEQRGRE